MSCEVSEASLRLAGELGAAGLRLAADSPGLLATVDQHAAEVRDALSCEPGEGRAGQHAERGPATQLLLAYARGFVEAATGRGWCPRTGVADWESLRLAAVCQLMTDQLAPQA